MARQDDYVNARRLAAEELGKRDPQTVARLSGAVFNDERHRLELDFIGRPHLVLFPDVAVAYADSDQEVPLTEQVLILHYLNQAGGTPLRNEAITYREVPAGDFYYPAFVKRAEAPMLKAFGADPSLLLNVGPMIGGTPISGPGDAVVAFPALPLVPVTLVIWGGDAEFEPSGKILFDRSVAEYLSTEDIAWLSGMIVYRLMRLAAEQTGGK